MSDKRDDIVNRLQTLGHPASEFLPDGKRLTLLIQCSHEAADEIERLRAQHDALRELLREAVFWVPNYSDIKRRIDAALKGDDRD